MFKLSGTFLGNLVKKNKKDETKPYHAMQILTTSGKRSELVEVDIPYPQPHKLQDKIEIPVSVSVGTYGDKSWLKVRLVEVEA